MKKEMYSSNLQVHNQNFSDAPLQNQRIFIYGAGQFGNDVYQCLTKMGYVTQGFIDHRARNLHLSNDLPVTLPDDEHLSALERKEAIIFIAIHNRDAAVAQISKHLSELGYGNLLTPVMFYDFLSEVLGERFWLTNRKYYFDKYEYLNQVLSLLHDETSRNEYISEISLRLTADYSRLPDPDIKNQYFPLDLPPLPSPVRFIDCGAFNGDTIRKLMKITDNIEEITAFEPDPKNFPALSEFCKKIHSVNIKLWPCASFSKLEALRFTEGGESGTISPSENTQIQGVALDDALPNFRPTYIKMDIEGSEMDALSGAKEMISKYRPRLGISLYHRPAHFWEIPLLLADWNLDYNFAIRSHGFNGFELVLYAIPM